MNVFRNSERIVITSGLRRGAKGVIVGIASDPDGALMIEVQLDGDFGTTLCRSSMLMRDRPENVKGMR